MKIKLKKISEDDLELIMNWRMDPKITKYMYTDPKLNLELQEKWYESISNDKYSIYWIILVDDIKIGVLNLSDMDYINRRCKWGCYIANSDYRGKGIFKLLEMNIYDYVFYNLKFNKLIAEVLSFNKKVIDSHLFCGSKIEGIFRDHIFKDNKFLDVVYMSILKREWEIIKKGKKYKKIEIEG